MLVADEGKTLTDGETYSPVVYLGKNESVDNWQEIDQADVLRKWRNKNDI